jgi:hypothetical protein
LRCHCIVPRYLEKRPEKRKPCCKERSGYCKIKKKLEHFEMQLNLPGEETREEITVM